jgi:hypothetical protein
MESLNLRVGGMESREDIRILREILEILPGIEAYDVLPGKVRIGSVPASVSLSKIFAVLAEAGEGYDVELE